MDKLEAELNEAVEANKKWQDYFNKDEKPDLTEDKLLKALEIVEAKKAEAKKAEQNEKEFEELQAEADYPEIYPEMQRVLKEKGKEFVNKMTPKELYDFAKHRLGMEIPVNRAKIKEDAEKKAVHQNKAKSQ